MNKYNFKYDFKLGTNVYDSDEDGQEKQVGHLTKLVVDPASYEVTDVIVESGLLFKRSTVIPIYKIEAASPRGVRLLLRKEELDDYPEFKETVVERGVQGWAQPASASQQYATMSTGALTAVPEVEVVRERVRLGISDDALVLLDDKTMVNGLDGTIGHLSQLSTGEEAGQMKQLIVEVNQRVLSTQEFLIPAYLVTAVSEQFVEIAATLADLSEVPVASS